MTQVQILDKIVSFHTNAFEKGMNLYLLPPNY